MRASRILGAVLLVGATAAAVTWARRRATVAPRADLYFEDGSSLGLDRETPEAERLFALARSLVGSGA